MNPPQGGKYSYWTNPELPADPDTWLSGATEMAGASLGNRLLEEHHRVLVRVDLAAHESLVREHLHGCDAEDRLEDDGEIARLDEPAQRRGGRLALGGRGARRGGRLHLI